MLSACCRAARYWARVLVSIVPTRDAPRQDPCASIVVVDQRLLAIGEGASSVGLLGAHDAETGRSTGRLHGLCANILEACRPNDLLNISGSDQPRSRFNQPR
jgi:hypothetical protein